MLELQTNNANLFEYATFELLLPTVIIIAFGAFIFIVGYTSNHRTGDDRKRHNRQLTIVVAIATLSVPIALCITYAVAYLDDEHADIGKYHAEAIVIDVSETDTPTTKALGDDNTNDFITEITVENNKQTYTFKSNHDVDVTPGDTIIFDTPERRLDRDSPTTAQPETKVANINHRDDKPEQHIVLPDGTEAVIINNALTVNNN